MANVYGLSRTGHDLRGVGAWARTPAISGKNSKLKTIDSPSTASLLPKSKPAKGSSAMLEAWKREPASAGPWTPLR
ncbi:hypothetical protein N7462_001770 [Penicillium macrosclerotiorum]|uniref:uncharacterized protein n=1 Tax=Penicillium macrosclerotiorum TaxID=303699 RepID=UPI002548A746|nr:uncharacterized protein N7462_001770 [Penicillium macrosclerotiorum]KAJ5692347.1 hypothetical protein N7462_001770 [Penicillium macrosclerotiorum]